MGKDRELFKNTRQGFSGFYLWPGIRSKYSCGEAYLFNKARDSFPSNSDRGYRAECDYDLYYRNARKLSSKIPSTGDH